jgi:hypothetical protein
MQLSRFKFLLIILFIPTQIFGFSDKNCLKGFFSSTISHKVKPFGVFENVLFVKKNECNITIVHKRYKYLKDQWHIDICRMPVHVKYGMKAVEVFKKLSSCSELPDANESGFCQHYKNLIEIFQDDGLIFAPGNKEDLFSDHGKLYCTFLLLEGYLKQGNVYNSSSKVINPKKKKFLGIEGKIKILAEKKQALEKSITVEKKEVPVKISLPVKSEKPMGQINADFMNEPVEGPDAFPGNADDIGSF